MASEESDSAQIKEQRRTSFGGYAAVYDAVRPSWPEPTMRWLTGDRPAGARVLDLGAGTGKGTRTLTAMGLDVTAVDPSEGMLAILRSQVPSARVIVAPAESIPLPDKAIDAIVSLQAWHWVDAEKAGDECARILAPGGTLGLAWHAPDERTPWIFDLAEAAGRVEDVEAEDWEAPAVGTRFGPAEAAVFDYELVLDVDGLVELASSWSYVALADDRAQRLARVRAVGEQVAVDGVIRYPHRTHCYRYPVLSSD